MGGGWWQGGLTRKGVEPSVVAFASCGQLAGCRARGAAGSFLGTALLKHQRVLCANLSKIKGSRLHCTAREDEIGFPQLERLDTF